MPFLEISVYILTGIFSGMLAGLFGVGGGVVIVPALILLFAQMEIGGDWIPHLAVGTSLATIIGTGAASTLAHHRRGGVRWDLFAKLAPGIVLGTWAGAGLVAAVPEVWLKRFFAGFLVFVGLRMLIRQGSRRIGRLPSIGGLWAVGGGIGMLSALVGIGGGTMTVPFLNSRGLEIRQAVGTSAAVGLPIAIAGTLGLIVAGWGRAGLPAFSTGFVYWPAVGIMLLASMPAAPLGARLAHALPVDFLKRLFGVLLLLVACDLPSVTDGSLLLTKHQAPVEKDLAALIPQCQAALVQRELERLGEILPLIGQLDAIRADLHGPLDETVAGGVNPVKIALDNQQIALVVLPDSLQRRTTPGHRPSPAGQRHVPGEAIRHLIHLRTTGKGHGSDRRGRTSRAQRQMGEGQPVMPMELEGPG